MSSKIEAYFGPHIEVDTKTKYHKYPIGPELQGIGMAKSKHVCKRVQSAHILSQSPI